MSELQVEILYYYCLTKMYLCNKALH